MPERNALAAMWDRIPPYVMLTIAVTGVVVSSAGAYFSLGYELRTLNNWRIEHLEHHRERAADLAASEAAMTTSLTEVRGQIDDVRRTSDELKFRLGAAEENARRTGEAITALQASVNAQASDIRVMREILERLDERRAQGEGTRFARGEAPR